RRNHDDTTNTRENHEFWSSRPSFRRGSILLLLSELSGSNQDFAVLLAPAAGALNAGLPNTNLPFWALRRISVELGVISFAGFLMTILPRFHQTTAPRSFRLPID
ncbi:MAG: hypothetical protein KDA44_18900, partial [Planctomycetales bacterium]|nr:hypothetical protein [Planctomycetales bacterium]